MKFDELIDLLKNAKNPEEIDAKKYEIAKLIPKVEIMFDYDQKNDTHQYDLWLHSVHTVLNLPKYIDDDMLYLAALLHDIGKPDCQVRGKNPDDINMHYYGHPLRSMEIVRDEILPDLYEKGVELVFSDQKRLLYYIEYHDDRLSLKQKHLRRHLKMVELSEFKKLMFLQIADAMAHNPVPIVQERIEICRKWAEQYADSLVSCE